MCTHILTFKVYETHIRLSSSKQTKRPTMNGTICFYVVFIICREQISFSFNFFFILLSNCDKETCTQMHTHSIVAFASISK